MSPLRDLPEIEELDARRAFVRIPAETDVPLTPRVRHILDSPEFRRLSQITQLGLVSLVYPAAHHTRLEHSLGVYHTALRYLKRLSHDERFTQIVGTADAERFLVAALLHDVGHWPFCHPLEDIGLPQIPRHEQFAEQFLTTGTLAEILKSEWNLDPHSLVSLLSGTAVGQPAGILRSMLSGPIDVDKMDYLQRDSLHAGVPYGRNFDQQRLIGSLCLNAKADGLAITEKGRTAAEMMVFCRYVMFSEVYWHHAVRSATAMLQRAVYELRDSLNWSSILHLTERPLIDHLLAQMTHHAGQSLLEGRSLLEGLFSPRRALYKRLFEFSYFQHQQLYQQLARQPYPHLVEVAASLADRLSHALREPVAAHEVLVDAPPVHREVEFHVDIYFPKEDCYRPLAEVSPVVRTLAREQFDDYVKRVRIFLHPRWADRVQSLGNLQEIIQSAVADPAGNAPHSSTPAPC